MSDSKREQIITLINAGHTANEIVDKVGCSRNYIYNIRGQMSKDQEKAIVAKRAKAKAKRAAKAPDPMPVSKNASTKPKKAKPVPATGVPIGLKERIVRGRRIVAVEFDLGAA